MDRHNRKATTITVAQYGTAGYVEWQDKEFWANDVCYSIFPHASVDNRFLYHFLKYEQRAIYSLVTDAIPAHLPQQRLANISIPVPTLAEQRHIVRILDKFETLTNSLTEGIPMELSLRRQQYEYYQNQLLSL